MNKKTRALSVIISVLCMISSVSYAQNDIKLFDYRLEYSADIYGGTFPDGYYSHKPFHPDYSIYFSGDISNSGTLDQHNIYFYATVFDSLLNTAFYDSVFSPIIGLTDSLFLEIPNSFNPLEGNNYKVSMSAIQDEIDVFPTDNYSEDINFRLSEERLITRHEEYNNNYSPTEYGYADGFAGIKFTVPEQDTVVSVKVFIDNMSTSGALIGQLYMFMDSLDADPILLMETEESIYQASSNGTWLELFFITVNAGDDIIEPGFRYMVGVEIFDNIFIGTDSTGHHNYRVENWFSDTLVEPLSEIPLVGVKFKNSSPSNNIDEINNSGINLYPNPAINQFQINLENINFNNIKSIKLYNSEGKHFNISYSNNLIFNSSNLDQGIYFLEIKTKTKTYREKIVITRSY